ncbi:MAG: hypothetical protein BWX47_02150 [candidate division Hyd24-12 bacterium ADurb.Bin004]|nr:MAG: hypothetical protein BWX47_02150 [candidate division Hyd24-12 bacterium ADurb.Bin004]
MASRSRCFFLRPGSFTADGTLARKATSSRSVNGTLASIEWAIVILSFFIIRSSGR